MAHKTLTELDTLRIRALCAERDALAARIELLQFASNAKLTEVRAAIRAAGIDPDKYSVVITPGRFPACTVIDLATGQPLEDEQAVPPTSESPTSAPSPESLASAESQPS